MEFFGPDDNKSKTNEFNILYIGGSIMIPNLLVLIFEKLSLYVNILIFRVFIQKYMNFFYGYYEWITLLSQ